MERRKVALYARVSTDNKGQDPRTQLNALREFVARQPGWVIVKEYVDECSGKNGDRPQFKQLWLDAEKHKFDLLLFWSLDRFTREGVLKTLQYLQRLKDHGIAFKSYMEQYVDSAGVFAEAVIGILAAIARQEHLRIGERIREGIAQKQAAGEWKGRGRNRKYKGGKPSKSTLYRWEREDKSQEDSTL